MLNKLVTDSELNVELLACLQKPRTFDNLWYNEILIYIVTDSTANQELRVNGGDLSTVYPLVSDEEQDLIIETPYWNYGGDTVITLYKNSVESGSITITFPQTLEGCVGMLNPDEEDDTHFTMVESATDSADIDNRVNTLDRDKQDNLTAGRGIDITNGIISAIIADYSTVPQKINEQWFDGSDIWQISYIIPLTVETGDAVQVPLPANIMVVEAKGVAIFKNGHKYTTYPLSDSWESTDGNYFNLKFDTYDNSNQGQMSLASKFGNTAGTYADSYYYITIRYIEAPEPPRELVYEYDYQANHSYTINSMTLEETLDAAFALFDEKAVDYGVYDYPQNVYFKEHWDDVKASILQTLANTGVTYTEGQVKIFARLENTTTAGYDYNEVQITVNAGTTEFPKTVRIDSVQETTYSTVVTVKRDDSPTSAIRGVMIIKSNDIQAMTLSQEGTYLQKIGPRYGYRPSDTHPYFQIELSSFGVTYE